MPAILGKDVTIQIGATPVAVVGQREGTFTMESEPIQTSAKADFPARTYVGGWTNWSGSLSAVTDLTDSTGLLLLEAAANEGTSVTIKFNHSTRYYSGTAFITSFERNAPYEDVDSASVQFQGSDTLTIDA